MIVKIVASVVGGFILIETIVAGFFCWLLRQDADPTTDQCY